MRLKMKKINFFFLIILLSLGSGIYAYAQPKMEVYKQNGTGSPLFDKSLMDYRQNERYDPKLISRDVTSNIQLIKSKTASSAQKSDEERKRLREEWKEFLGIDVFYPYFKAKDVEEYVQKKSAVRFFNMHGRPEFNEDSKEVKYIFKRKF
jgi:hypothetical protein